MYDKYNLDSIYDPNKQHYYERVISFISFSIVSLFTTNTTFTAFTSQLNNTLILGSENFDFFSKFWLFTMNTTCTAHDLYSIYYKSIL